ncbi:Flp pilus assembly protein CpaB [Granulicoccus phenolivorans]|uniref:Flp pilus assembly protein CpaB n=1 Tax=Granulicoccus phenolivorans TaxID=266854 RepID=UPI0004017DE7|nr:Flp pilus assembly protein CpaB [Granulicoccus phenolivorans]
MRVPRLRRFLTRHRRILAALAAATSIALTGLALSPGATDTTAVLVAAGPLPGGRTLTAADLRIAHWPTAQVPAEALTDPADAEGRILATPLTAASPLTQASLVHGRAVVAEGKVIATVRLSDPAQVALVRPGDRVDVIAAEGPRSGVVARNVRVVTIPQPAGDPGLLGGGETGAAMLLVETDEPTATELARAATGSRLSLVLR